METRPLFLEKETNSDDFKLNMVGMCPPLALFQLM